MSIEKIKRPGGGYEVSGITTFTTTGATKTVPAKGLRRLVACHATAVGTPASDEVLSINETVGADGRIDVPADGEITITRTGAVKTSGLAFSYTLIGY